MTKANYLSYKDTSGFIVQEEGIYFRYISYFYQKEFDFFDKSELKRQLLSKNLFLDYSVVENNDINYYKKIKPIQVDFINYPYEWTFEQWRTCILNFIEINKISLSYGMILKDATPFNFTFINSNCVLIDTLSFTFYKDGDFWLAYNQFCRQMLGVFLLMGYKGLFLNKLAANFPDGLTLSQISKLLGLKSYLNPLCFFHIHLAKKFEGGKSKQGISKGFTTNQLRFLLDSLKNEVKKIKYQEKSNWTSYYTTDIIYDDYLKNKQTIVENWVIKLNPNCLIDVGANTGYYSFAVSKFVQRIISIEQDPESSNELYKKTKNNPNCNITSINCSFNNPSPDGGLNSTERKSLMLRLEGDTMMALGIIHHLCFSYNIPLSLLAKVFFAYTATNLIIEFIPAEDNNAIKLIQNKQALLGYYSEDSFIEAFSRYYILVDKALISKSKRKLYLWKKSNYCLKNPYSHT